MNFLNKEESPGSFKKFFPLFLTLFVLFILLIGSTLFFYSKYKKASNSQQPFTEIEQVVRNVSRLMELPQGETPTLATVSDKTKLQNQSFFQKAENGDRILVYAQAKKAILYRPSTDKIVDIAPVMSLADLDAPKTIQSIKIALYNGTKISSLPALAEEKINEDPEIGSQIEIVKKQNTMKPYSKTMIIDLKGDQQEMADKLASLLSGSIEAFPQGEIRPETDFLVILGQ